MIDQVEKSASSLLNPPPFTKLKFPFKEWAFKNNND